MKLFISCLLFLTFSVATAQNFIVSPNEPIYPSFTAPPPVANQNFFLWSPQPLGPNMVGVVELNMNASEVRVFFRGPLCSSGLPIDPPPPTYSYFQSAQISGLNIGTYTLSIYQVPNQDVFPPAVADYPTYFCKNFEFQVFGQPSSVNVNATTNLGLVLLGLCMLLAGTLFHKRRFFN